MKTKLKPRWSKAFNEYRIHFDVAEPGAVELADWLDSDVSSEEVVGQLIAAITDVEGNKQIGERIDRGNAHRILAKDQILLIECLYIFEQKVLLTRPQAISALEHYLEFLRSCIKVPTQPPEPFEVEYEAGGDEALRRYQALGGTEALTREDIDT